MPPPKKPKETYKFKVRYRYSGDTEDRLNKLIKHYSRTLGMNASQVFRLALNRGLDVLERGVRSTTNAHVKAVLEALDEDL